MLHCIIQGVVVRKECMLSMDVNFFPIFPIGWLVEFVEVESKDSEGQLSSQALGIRAWRSWEGIT